MKTFDAIVVGSGCTGGWIAKELTEAGFETLVLEAGPEVPLADVPLPGWVSPDSGGDAPASQRIQSQHPAYSPANAALFVHDDEHPYTTPEGKPFVWIRSRQVGGRSLLWGRICIRMSDFELKAASADGIGEDWPIGYDDLAPHYARVERFHGARGARDGLVELPDGDLLPPASMTRAEEHFKRAVEARWADRHVIVHRGIDEPSSAAAWPAHTAQGSTLAAAAATGHLVLRSDAIVTQVLATGDRARGVRVIDRVTLAEAEIEARVVILCASTIETARILLHSASAAHPNGLANGSGAVGRFLTDRPSSVVVGRLPEELHAKEPLPVDGPHGIFVPRFRNLGADEAPYRRAFGIWGAMARGPIPDRFILVVQGEMLPAATNRVTLDPQRRDRWGMPIAHIDCVWQDNDRELVRDGVACAEEMARAAGFSVARTGTLGEPGSFIHELGTARMGRDPKTSVLNGQNQSWEVENLFVADGACFTSAGYQNPTLTMMALASRCGRFVAGELAARRL